MDRADVPPMDLTRRPQDVLADTCKANPRLTRRKVAKALYDLYVTAPLPSRFRAWDWCAHAGYFDAVAHGRPVK